MPTGPWNRLTALVFLVSPFCAGCFGGYAYPTAALVTRATLEKPATDTVHAFRVDILDTSGSIEFAGADEYLFREVLVTARGDVPAQTKIGVGSGWWAVL